MQFLLEPHLFRANYGRNCWICMYLGERSAAFLCGSGGAMRRILVDHARRKAAAKRGGERTRVELDNELAAIESPCNGVEDLVALDDALERLEREDPGMAQLDRASVPGLPSSMAAVPEASQRMGRWPRCVPAVYLSTRAAFAAGFRIDCVCTSARRQRRNSRPSWLGAGRGGGVGLRHRGRII